MIGEGCAPGRRNTALDVVTAGEAMALFVARQAGALERVDQFSRTTAGAELNVAIGLARLGLRVGYISRLGDDSLGRHLLAALDREGIDRRHVALDPQHPTGLMFKSLSVDGADPSVEYFRRGSAASRLTRADYPAEYCAGARHLHLSGVAPALSTGARELVFHMAHAARAEARCVSFDPNLRPRLWGSDAAMVSCLNALAALSDLVLPGLAEGRRLTGRDSPEAIARHYLDAGARAVVVKLGAGGAYFESGSACGTVLSVLGSP